MSDRAQFNQKLDSLFHTFFMGLEHWVKEFEHFAHRRKEASAISNSFLDRHAKILIHAFDELLVALTEEYEDLVKENLQLTTAEKKQDLYTKMIHFKSQGTHLLRRINVKSELLLKDSELHPFSHDVQSRLKELSTFSYDDLIHKLKSEK